MGAAEVVLAMFGRYVCLVLDSVAHCITDTPLKHSTSDVQFLVDRARRIKGVYVCFILGDACPT